MRLSRKILSDIKKDNGIIIPDERIFNLPEKVLQFGTGVLLRGLPDYFIDKANRQGIFNGRIVVVKSTSNGSTNEFANQDNLYTLTIRGIENGEITNETIIHSCISRVLTASNEWNKIIECAANPEMEIIISNTTEVGITYTEDDIHDTPPKSFPGKLLAFLLARYTVTKGAKESGMVIVPTELIPDNGNKLKSILIDLATYNNLDAQFVKWMLAANHFCNSLVDRIVPGKLAAADKIETEKMLGYTDDLLIMAEPFRLWAIESGNANVKKKMSFASVDEGVLIEPSIEKFRELKLRLLNGTHTFSCGLAVLSGFHTVKEAMDDEGFASYIHSLMQNEIAPAIQSDAISKSDTRAFTGQVTDRFSNPYLEHQWMNITLQYSSKMKMRNVPILAKHYMNTSKVPELMALGFSSFILFMNAVKNADGKYEGTHERKYIIEDDNAGIFADAWKLQKIPKVVQCVLGNKSFWGIDLSAFPGFSKAVEISLRSLMEKNVLEILRNTSINKVDAL